MEIIVKIEVPDDDKNAVGEIATALSSLKKYHVKSIGEDTGAHVTYRGPQDGAEGFVRSKLT